MGLLLVVLGSIHAINHVHSRNNIIIYQKKQENEEEKKTPRNIIIKHKLLTVKISLAIFIWKAIKTTPEEEEEELSRKTPSRNSQEKKSV